MLELSGCIVAIDAMGCQKEIAQTIVKGGADYLLAVKENQGQLYQGIRDLFEAGEGSGLAGLPHDYATTLNHVEQGTRAHRTAGVLGDG